MYTIEKIEILDEYEISFRFSDGLEKIINFEPFIGEDALTSRLKDKDYFRQVKIYENGRGIYWPNEYDVCPDFIRKYEQKKEMSSM